MRLGKNFNKKEIRERAGLTQAEVAKKLGVGRATVQRFEYGLSRNKTLQDFYVKQKLQNVRNELGLTQRELAKLLNVSQSSISRFEKGTLKDKTLSTQLLNIYTSIDDNYVRGQRIKEFIEKKQEVMRRYENIAALEKTGKYASKIPFAEYIRRNPLPATSLYDEENIFNQDTNVISMQIGRLNYMLGMQTSTEEGVKLWREHVAEASKKQTGFQDAYDNVVFWDLYEKIMSNKDVVRRKYPKYNFDSKQVRAHVIDIMSTLYDGTQSVQELFDLVFK